MTNFQFFIDSVLKYQFLQNALLAGIMVGIICGLIGCFIILRGMSLMGDAISHAVLPGVVISYLLGYDFFIGAVITGVITSFGIGYITQNSKIKDDTAIGIMFTAAFALGVVLITLNRGSGIDLHHILFGNVLAVSRGDLLMTLYIGILVIIGVVIFYKHLLLTTFDLTLAKSIGMPTKLIHYLLMLMLSLVTVASLKTVGIILVVAMLITPGATAYLLTNRLPIMLLLSSIFGIISSVAGVYFSYIYDVSTGATIVLVASGMFALSFIFSPKTSFLSEKKRVAILDFPNKFKLKLGLKLGHLLKSIKIKIKEELPMLNKKTSTLILIIISTILILATGCTVNDTSTEGRGEDTGLYITTSFSVLGDIVSHIVGNRGTVDFIVPVGEEPHEYEPIPSDFVKLSNSDIFYINGLDLEEWLEKVVSNVTSVDIVTVSDGITPILLENEEEADPHAWLSPRNVIIYVENILQDLIARDPEGEKQYRSNAENYINELVELDEWITNQVAIIPEENRVIVLSENAFKYFGADYGFHTEGIWEINSHEEGTPQQFARLIDLVKEQEVPALFVETTIDNRYMETISSGTNIPIYGEVFTDALGPMGSNGDSYIGMMRENINTFIRGLSAN